MNATELSKRVWEIQLRYFVPKIKWSIIDHARPLANGLGRCNLCLTEKYHIIMSNAALLNKRSELVSKCRHENKFLLMNCKVPPDIDTNSLP